MGSTRLPGKVLMPVLGRPMLWHVVRRTGQARLVDQVVVATTRGVADQAIVSLCEAEGWAWFRGSEEDLLDRYYQAALSYQAGIVVRITADCPLIDPAVVDQVVAAFLQAQPLDYASNTLPPRTFPRGLDTEVLSFGALARAWQEDTNPAWREHVTPYIYKNPGKFRLRSVAGAEDYSALRWTVDREEDLAFVRTVFAHFGTWRFTWQEVLQALADHPEWLAINRHVRQKTVP